MKTERWICTSDERQEKQSSYERPVCEVVVLNSEGFICTSGGTTVGINTNVEDYQIDGKYSATLGW